LTPLLSLVIPTYNESRGLESLIGRIFAALERNALSAEVIVVDDNSPDGTGELAEELARRHPLKVVHRSGKLGLSSAVLDGWAVAEGRVLGVMDADLSHDPEILPDMLASITEGGAEVAVGSRYIPGGGLGNWPWFRRVTSKTAVLMGRPICPVHDVTSGYLMFRRSVIQGVQLDPIGFKIGLEVLVRGRYRTFTEVPYTFTDRAAGKSKFGLHEIRNYLVQLIRLAWHWLGTRPRRERVPYLRAPGGTTD
jgi:dolichol-phosphate mannosyltransferase